MPCKKKRATCPQKGKGKGKKRSIFKRKQKPVRLEAPNVDSVKKLPYKFSKDYKNKLNILSHQSENYRTRFVTPYTNSKHLSHYKKRDLIYPSIKEE